MTRRLTCWSAPEREWRDAFHIKPVDEEFNGEHAYVSSVLSIAANLHRVLEAETPGKTREAARQEGEIICDKQRQAENAIRRAFHRRELPVPAFGNSEQSAGIQIADWLCSALVAPLAAARLLPESRHADPRYLALAEGEKLRLGATRANAVSL